MKRQDERSDIVIVGSLDEYVHNTYMHSNNEKVTRGIVVIPDETALGKW